VKKLINISSNTSNKHKQALLVTGNTPFVTGNKPFILVTGNKPFILVTGNKSFILVTGNKPFMQTFLTQSGVL